MAQITIVGDCALRIYLRDSTSPLSLDKHFEFWRRSDVEASRNSNGRHLRIRENTQRPQLGLL